MSFTSLSRSLPRTRRISVGVGKFNCCCCAWALEVGGWREYSWVVMIVAEDQFV